MDYPNKILIPSDDTELEFIRIENYSKRTSAGIVKWKMIKYKYTKSFVSLGKEIEFTPESFEESIRKERFIPLA